VCKYYEKSFGNAAGCTKFDNIKRGINGRLAKARYLGKVV
jgi:hypothetical protein